eukprot:scaffold20480_cov30-Tisochrysis_lutea.AAC.2
MLSGLLTQAKQGLRYCGCEARNWRRRNSNRTAHPSNCLMRLYASDSDHELASLCGSRRASAKDEGIARTSADGMTAIPPRRGRGDEAIIVMFKTKEICSFVSYPLSIFQLSSLEDLSARDSMSPLVLTRTRQQPQAATNIWRGAS